MLRLKRFYVCVGVELVLGEKVKLTSLFEVRSHVTFTFPSIFRTVPIEVVARTSTVILCETLMQTLTLTQTQTLCMNKALKGWSCTVKVFCDTKLVTKLRRKLAHPRQELPDIK